MSTWKITDPLENIDNYDIKIPENIKKGQRIVIFSHDKIPMITAPVTSTGKKAVLRAIEKGMNDTSKLQPGNRNNHYFFDKERKYNKNEIIYKNIAGYFDSGQRLKYIEKYEKGELKPVDLCGDNIYLESLCVRGKYIYLWLGS